MEIDDYLMEDLESEELDDTKHPNYGMRQELARQLHGDGLEFGPGCHPLPLGPFVNSIRYCDVFTRDEFAEQFPEMNKKIVNFPDPIDYQFDFEKEWFVERIGKESLDFVVANHVLEHLVNPIRFLEQCHSLLKDNGILFIGLPDKRRMFDRDRQRTLLNDVVERYQRDEVVVSEARIVEFVNQVVQPGEFFSDRSANYAVEIDRHRRRSLHVNVWLMDDVIELFRYQCLELDMPWELLDGVAADEEFLLLFRKAESSSVVDKYPATLARLWHESQQFHLESRYLPRLDELRRLCIRMHHRLLVLDERQRETQNFIRRLKQLIRHFPGSGVAERFLKRRS